LLATNSDLQTGQLNSMGLSHKCSAIKSSVFKSSVWTNNLY